MPQAFDLQTRMGQASSQPDPQLDLQTPSSTLRQHVDPEALPRPDYFDSLDDLHLWYQMQYGDALHDNLEPCGRHTGPPPVISSRLPDSRPKLVVCHDFQGGYNEDPRHRGYSLEHMHLIDTFIYFSHKRVSIPPVGWLTAAATAGTKVLGTVIFEWAESVPDMARLLRGPQRKAMPLRGEPCFSPQYAVELIELALDRGFSGYLVNIEVGLDLGFSCSGEAWPAWIGQQARIVEMHRNAERLRAWVHFLREEGTRRFIQAGKDADEWHVMWYDSVVYPYGQLAWQDALNQHNVAFFQAAHTLFTNYTWAKPPQPLPPGQLVDPNDENPQLLQLRGFGLTGPDDGGFHPQLLLSAAIADSFDRPREDVYVGIDVFGRNCWGGLKAWRSLGMIGPQRVQEDALGLSVALFAPGWTWEEENAGLELDATRAAQKRNWSDWWHIDSAFWIGLPSRAVAQEHRIALSSNDVKPIQSYFSRSDLGSDRCRRRASEHGFYTDFSFGSGKKWFDRGELVHAWTKSEEEKEAGFTDMGTCMPKPDLLYAEWHDMNEQRGSLKSLLESVAWDFDQDRVWSGTASLIINMTARKDETTSSHQVHIPLCSAVVVKGKGNEWQYTLVYDANERDVPRVEPTVTLALPPNNHNSQSWIALGDAVHRDMGHGWREATISFQLPQTDDQPDLGHVALSLGLSLSLEPGQTAAIRIGALQLSNPARAYSTPDVPPLNFEVRPALDVFDSSPSNHQAKRLQAAVLDWTSAASSSTSSYYNVWIQQVKNPGLRLWLGTSTREASPFEFCLPNHLVLPPHLSELEQGELEYVVTTLDIAQPQIVARARATLV